MGKRKIIEKRAWKALRRYYTEGKAFKVSATEECLQCSQREREEKERLEEERRNRDLELSASPALTALYARRTGGQARGRRERKLDREDRHIFSALPHPRPPSGCPPSSFSLPPSSSSSALFLPPLDPGLYHLLPRCWLTVWRNYLRDPRAPRPRPPDLSLLLCEAHGLPLVPPHISSFLDGEKKGVLSSLNGRSGVVCEIVSVEEWDELMKHYPTDYCLNCEPGVDDMSVTYRNRQRKWSF
ncbi:hypothetical protein NGA_0462100 [Nannochloropsis gaditana CCMP526]|uniref:uncharacterized protein n=1 Tax=Nannochloropsis gaditana (strain CCMP526) TaxID=1093141 RepID=UPI00029F7520|nr:hypothetical protein NGA_0462100 [Nannochloropsis gaditana CCMP526]EKU22399.1 hypothetical protein NGA_0462100 [Nannochloropsis gaditana CCMP526]|eukprot:XP_005853965.1 hypothetical protein NGA_0462100 [Nannochloropsis gaditana CCMP526]